MLLIAKLFKEPGAKFCLITLKEIDQYMFFSKDYYFLIDLVLM